LWVSLARYVRVRRPVPVWRPLAGLIRRLPPRTGCDPSQSCRSRFHPQTDAGVVPPTHGWRSVGMLADQLDFVVGVQRTLSPSWVSIQARALSGEMSMVSS